MRIVSIVGTRPQLVKLGPLAKAFEEVAIEHLVIHTGQHYDRELSGNFLTEFGLGEPWRNLEVGSASAPVQVAHMLLGLAPLLEESHPDVVLVPGDTNSTLAGALAAAQLDLPIAHVEAGLRSFDRTMPEERNRIVTDHLSSVLYAPSARAVAWLADEGIAGEHVVEAGDVMRDVIDATELAPAEGEGHVLVTVHRPRNTDDPTRLAAILRALEKIAATGRTVVWPVHPRTRNVLAEDPKGVSLRPPLGHAELLGMVASAACVVTDSGGLQKEAYWLGVPCVSLRAETEWVETVDSGWNHLADADTDKIISAVESARPGREPRDAYGEPGAAARIASDLITRFAPAR